MKIGPASGEETPTSTTDLIDSPAKLVPGEHEDSVIQAFTDFWTKLMQPECALLVQGMRSVLRNMETTSSLESMGTTLKGYLEKTNELLKSHVAWKDDPDHDSLRRSLESFVFGQAQEVLANKLEWSELFPMSESDWIERIAQLQFVEPSHLEIECLQMDGINLDELLLQPKEALLSMDRYYSPYEKLTQRLKSCLEISRGFLEKKRNGWHSKGVGLVSQHDQHWHRNTIEKESFADVCMYSFTWPTLFFSCILIICFVTFP